MNGPKLVCCACGEVEVGIIGPPICAGCRRSMQMEFASDDDGNVLGAPATVMEKLLQHPRVQELAKNDDGSSE